MALQSSTRSSRPGVLRPRVRKPGSGRVIGDKFVGRSIRIYIPLLAFLAVMLFPFYWLPVTSFKSAFELFDFSVSLLWVRVLFLALFQHVFIHLNFQLWSFNTALL